MQKRTQQRKNSAQRRSNGSVAKIATGIEGFDLIAEGGLPKGRTTLVSGTSGAGKTIFALEFLWRGVTEQGEPAVFVTFEENPADIIKNVKGFGWDLKQLESDGSLAFVDASPVLGDSEVVGTYDFGALIARIKHAIKKIKAKRVALDSVSALFPRFAETGLIRSELFRLGAELKSLGVTTLMTAERLSEFGEIARFGVEEFVSDNVIILRNILENEKRRRTVEILKYRGAMHQKGEYPFTISSTGISILPLSAMKLEQKSTDVRITSGVAELDRMCGGGFFRDSIILVSGATGTGKTLTVTTFANGTCEEGERAMLFAFEESRDQLLRNGTSWGMKVKTWEDKGLLKVICRYPETMGLEDHLLLMRKEIDEFKPTRIAVDSLSALERVSSIKTFREFVIGLTSHLKTRQIARLFTNTTPSLSGGESVTETHISSITDSIILLRYVEIHGEMRRGIGVLKMRGSWHDKEVREYEITNTGMNIGGPFTNVEGIMLGTPRVLFSQERDRLASIASGNGS